MSDLLQQFLDAQDAFKQRVHAVRADQWDAPTPDSEWTVRRLVEHLIDEHRWAAPLLHGHDLDAAGAIVRGARDEGSPAGNWDVAATESADAFSEDGALGRTVHLSRGPTPAQDYIREMIFDLVVHSWDLQTAIGFSGDLPSAAVESTYAVAQGYGDLSASGMFDAPVDVPDDASTLDKLIALTGRDPRG